MTIQEYFVYALKNEFLTEKKFYFTCMTIPVDTKNEYYEVKNNKYYVYVDGKTEEIEKINAKERPLLYKNDPIVLFNSNMSSVKTQVDTTIGKAIVNYILLYWNFKDKVEYVNEYVSSGDIEKLLPPLCLKKIITIEEYLDFITAANMLQGLSIIFTVSATYKSLTPPDGLKEEKERLNKEFTKLYGPSWYKKDVYTIKYIDALKEYDANYLKGDPTDGILVSGKVKNNARVKMFLTFGSDSGFKELGEEIDFVDESLTDGYPKDAKKAAMIINSNRSGSFSRGAETIDGGVVTKIMARATANVTIEQGDCGSKIFKPTLITKNNAGTMQDRYLFESGKLVKIEDPKKYIGKLVMLRSPMYCKHTSKTFCSTCTGEMLGKYRKGATIISTDISGALLNASMKKMHNSQKKIVVVDPLSLII